MGVFPLPFWSRLFFSTQTKEWHLGFYKQPIHNNLTFSWVPGDGLMVMGDAIGSCPSVNLKPWISVHPGPLDTVAWERDNQTLWPQKHQLDTNDNISTLTESLTKVISWGVLAFPSGRAKTFFWIYILDRSNWFVWSWFHFLDGVNIVCGREEREREIFVNDRGEPGTNYAGSTSYN